MKKIIYSLLGIAVIVIIAITSCQKTDEVINSNLKKMSFESYEKYSKIHDDFLSHFKNEFVINPNITTSSEGIDYITQFYINFAMGLDLSADEKNTLIKSLEDYKRFLYTPEFYNELFVSEESTGLYFESIKQAHKLGIIDDFEFDRINLIGQKAKDNHDGLISYEETPYTFSDNQKSTKALPVWAASDIAGAGYSAVVAKMDLKTILISILIGIIGGGLAELTVKWFYKNKKKITAKLAKFGLRRNKNY
jgi:hypothetical protein